MSASISTLVGNAVFFGVALAVLLLLCWLASRVTGRMLRFALRWGAKAEQPLFESVRVRHARRVVLLLTTVLSLALIGVGVVLTLNEVAVTPMLRTWLEAEVLRDPSLAAWLLGELVALVVAALLLYAALRALVGLVLGRLAADPVFMRYHEQFARLQTRVTGLLRAGALFATLLAAARLLRVSAAVADPLATVTLIVVAVAVARVLVALVDVGVDIAIQLARALDGRPTPLRYLGRLEHLGGITKRTFEYFCFVGAATFVVDQLRPDTWLSQSGLVLIRLIALIYVGRVVIEVFGLILREVLLSAPEGRSEAEQQQRMTLVPVASSVLRYGVYFCVTVMGLQELGVDTSPILAGAGLLGLAVGLGAQAFVGDVVSGFFILFEGLFLVGDRIRVGEVAGAVEEIGIRVLKVRDEFGVLHCIPNGEVRSVANHARQYVNAIVDFSLPYDHDVARIVEDLGRSFADRRAMHPDILADSEFNIQELLATGALVRCVTRVKPSRDDAVADTIRAELLAALGGLGVAPGECHVIKTRAVHGTEPPRRDLPAGAVPEA